MSNIDPEIQARIAWDKERRRQRAGINAAAELGVFDSSIPELDLVAQRDREIQEQWDRANAPQKFTSIPTFDTDATAVPTPNVSMPIAEKPHAPTEAEAVDLGRPAGLHELETPAPQPGDVVSATFPQDDESPSE